MKSAVLICTLSILGACFADESDAMTEARDRADAANSNFNTAYSSLTSGDENMALLNKMTEFQNNVQTKIDAANEQIRLPVDEFSTNISMELGNGLDSECYHMASLHIKVDVTHYVDYSYQTGMTYSQTVSHMFTLLNDIMSEKYYDLSVRFSTARTLPNLSAEVLNALTDEFERKVAAFITSIEGLFSAFGTELEKVLTKFEDANTQRVTVALSKLQTVKENYAMCKAYGYYGY